MNELFWSALERWYYTKLWGLAHGNGWADEPLQYIQAITVIESEQKSIEAEEHEKAMEDMKNKSSKSGRKVR